MDKTKASKALEIASSNLARCNSLLNEQISIKTYYMLKRFKDDLIKDIEKYSKLLSE